MTDKTFKIVGVSTQGKIIKFRVANGDMVARVKVLERNGHTDIDLIELDTPLNKMEAIEAYKVSHPGTSEIRMPNEKTETATTPKTRTVSIKKPGKTVDAATALLNEVDATETTVEA